ncbi:hypothetical protein CEQ90_14845 [Lewinellaceae bacterium SD302]|nr:hypothetical protein CEQ90_14845 [Lewinellaceae bacterium SD302]
MPLANRHQPPYFEAMNFFVPCRVFFALLLLITVQIACIPPGLQDEEDNTRVSIDLKDLTTRKLAEFQDLRLTDSLLPYLEHENASYRYFAASAFGSYSDEEARLPLVALLDDPQDLVRSAAAYALGQQLPSSERLGEELIANFRLDSANRSRESFSYLLQAIGKQASERRLEQLASVKNYADRDTNLLAGTAWSIFYFARRGLLNEAGTARALELSIGDHAQEIRYPALAYLARYAPELDGDQVAKLSPILSDDPSADLRMLAALAVAKSPNQNSATLIEQQLGREKDWRVRSNLLGALNRFDYTVIRRIVPNYLDDPHELVAQRAAGIFVNNGSPEDATYYWKMARDSSLTWSVRYKLYQAANQHLPVYFSDYRGSINYQLQQRFAQTEDVYQKTAILESLAAFPWNYRIIQDLGLNSKLKPVNTAAVRALASISGRDDFDEFFRSSNRRVRIELAQAFQLAIESGDAGMIYEAAQPLSQPDNPYLLAYPDLNWAKTTLSNLPLPEMVESYRALQNAINQLEGRPQMTEFAPPEYSRPIDWEALTAAGDAPIIRIHTSKGKVDLALWPELAPNTVSNLLRLAKEEFFNGKPFHRVVPNFVVQGGDPRGDGYGSVDFSIRTETPMVHWDRSGLIGMASAGRDTESIQFFITHSGTPHLDGNYTAFGAVTEGQEVVDALLVGDLIERVEIR